MRHWLELDDRFAVVPVAALSVLVCAATTGCGPTTSSSCSDVAVNEDVALDLAAPPSLLAPGTRIERCIGSDCDTSRLDAAGGGARCVDVDGHTPTFPLSCSTDASGAGVL